MAAVLEEDTVVVVDNVVKLDEVLVGPGVLSTMVK